MCKHFQKNKTILLRPMRDITESMIFHMSFISVFSEFYLLDSNSIKIELIYGSTPTLMSTVLPLNYELSYF